MMVMVLIDDNNNDDNILWLLEHKHAIGNR